MSGSKLFQEGRLNQKLLRKILSILITVVFTFVVLNGCADKKDPDIYDNYPDDSENNDEGGCGVIPDENGQKPDETQNDDDAVQTQDEFVTYDEEFLPDSDEAAVTETDIETEDDIQDSDIADDSDAIADTCPDDMVGNGTFCIDKFEASKKDATDISHGSDESVAVSKKGVLPWMVNPMTAADYQKFKTACTAAGKRLCRDDEWIFSCEGAEKTKYSWGGTYNREICNTVDAFCDEHCETNSIAPENCLMSENCGYSYYCFNVVKTGDFLNCINHSGAFDINGNVWEITDTGSAYKIRGGAFNCGNPSSRLECGYNATWSELFAGFRCCKDR